MSSDIVLQILLFIQVFIIGILAVLAAQYALKHYRQDKREKPSTVSPAVSDNLLTEEMKTQLLKSAQEHFQTAVKNSSVKLQHELDVSGQDINILLKKLATQIVDSEVQNYHQQLSRLLSEANSQLGGINEQINKHRSELTAQLDKEIAAEKQVLVKQIDTKLADAVGSFLNETLQHNIDLGSQSSYLVGLLEEHKSELIKEVGNEDKPEK